MFKPVYTLDLLNQMSQHNMAGSVGIEYLELGPDFLRARMPVDHRTTQPYGLLHGGASAVLAETLGSVASQMTLDPEGNEAPVGLEINANHLRGVKAGAWVYGKVTPIHVGRRTHVWDIRITDENGAPVCVSRLTVMIVSR